jgi:cobalamin synthase
MRNEILRDVLAGCAGVLAVAAVIGLPKGSASAHVPADWQVQHAVLLPHFSKVGTPAVPQVPRTRITIGP